MKKHVITRRDFLKLAAAFAAASALAACDHRPTPAPTQEGEATQPAAEPTAAACRKGSPARRAQGSVPHPGEPIRDCATGR